MRRILLTLVLAVCEAALWPPPSIRCATAASPTPPAAAAESTFAALFDTFVPGDSLPLPAALVTGTREAMWRQLSGSAAFLAQLELLDSLAQMPGGPPLRRASRARREEQLAALAHSPSLLPRNLAAAMRRTILGGAYGSRLGELASGYERPSRNASHIEAFVERQAPRFPPTWLTLDSVAHELRPRSGTIDVLIVGSGPCGSVIAHELAAAGLRVLVVDQGPFVLPGAFQTRAEARLLESGGRRASASGGILFSNAEAVGGGTTVNIDLAFDPSHPSIRRQIEGWRNAARIPADLWPPATLEKCSAWARRAIGTRTPDRSEVNANNGALWDGATRRGLKPRLYDLNTWAPGSSPYAATDKRSALSQLLIPAMTDTLHPVALIPDARVEKIIFERGKGLRVARGVQIVTREPWGAPGVVADPLGLGLRANDTLTVRARNVILCAGALGSTALLLRSGLESPALGRGIVAHPAMPIIGEFDRRIDAFSGTPATVYVDDFAMTRHFFLEAMSAGPEYVAVMAPGDGRQVFERVSAYRRLAGFGAMIVDESSWENRIALDASGRPIIQYELTDRDRTRLRDAVGEAVRIMFAAGAHRVFLPTNEGDPDSGRLHTAEITSPQQADSATSRLMFIPGRTIVTSAHLQSGCRMGLDPDSSVVSPRHAVWGTERLYVVDSSVFPGSIGANPMQSLYSIAKDFADRMLPEIRAGSR